MADAWNGSWGTSWGTSWTTTPAPAVVLLGGGPGGSKWDKKKHEYFFTPAWQKYAEESARLETEAAAREQSLREERDARDDFTEPQVRPDAPRLRLQPRFYTADDFAVYQAKVTQEITDLRIRRDRLIRQRQEEEVVLSILQSLPPLH
jgi:hypothetical protein